jgi:hypothetical protein
MGDENLESSGCRSSMTRAGPTPGQVEGLVAFRVMFSCALDSLKLWSLGADVLPKTAGELGSSGRPPELRH